MAWLAKKGTVYIGINNTKAPSVGGLEKVEVEYEKSSLSFLSTISKEYNSFDIRHKDIHSLMFQGQNVVEIRDIHDLRVLLTDNPDFISEAYFPKKRIIKNYEQFGKRVLQGTGRSIAQIFHPMKNRTESLKMLNILHMARDTLAMRVNGDTLEWEAAPIDTNTFDYSDGDESEDSDSEEGDGDEGEDQVDDEDESDDTFSDAAGEVAEDEDIFAKKKDPPVEKPAVVSQAPPKKAKPAPEKKRRKKTSPDGKEPKEKKGQKGETNFSASMLDLADGNYDL